MIKKNNSNNNSKTNNNIIKNNECPILKNSENNLLNRITNYNTKKVYFNNKLIHNNFNFKTQENFSNKKRKYINTTFNPNLLKRQMNFLKPNQTEINMEFGLSLDYNDEIKTNNNSSKNMNKIFEYSNNSYNIKDNKGINKGINHKNLIIRINNRYENNNNNYIQNYIKKNKYNTNTNNYFYNNKQKIENKNQCTDNIIKIEQNQDYFKNLESKIYKKALEQFYRRIIKYCHLILKNDFSLILFTIKNYSRNKFQQKTYKKKSIFNKNIFLSNNNNKKKEHVKNVLSPLKNFNLVKTAKLKFDERNILTTGNKTNDTNNLDEKESYTNSIQSNKSSNLISGLYKNKSKFFSERKNDIYIKKNNIKSKQLNNNNLYISPRKKSKYIYNTNSLRLNNEYYNIYTESNPIKNKNIYDLNLTKNLKTFLPDKSQFFNSNNLIIDNKNSFNYLNKSANNSIPKKSKRKYVNKNEENKNKIEINKEELKLKKKKKYFNIFINKLRNITFCFHMNKIFSISKSNNIKYFFNYLKEIKNEKEQIKNISKEEKLNDYNINSKDSYINIKELTFNDYEINNELFQMNEKDNNINDLNMIENNIEKNIESNIENNINKKENETIDINKENENYPLKKEESCEINFNKYENIINNNKININENENNINEKEHEHKDELMENLKQMNSDDIIIEEKKENIINNNDSIDSLNNINDKNNEFNKNDNVIDNSNSSIKKETEIIPDININTNNINDESNDNKKSLDLIDINENNKIEENIKERNLLMNKIINNISYKVNNVLNKKYFNIWKDIIIKENKKKLDNDNNMEIIKEPENKIKIENDEKINNDNNNKTFFGDDVNDEEKKVILDEILQRFKILLIEFHLKNSQNISDSCELFLDDK